MNQEKLKKYINFLVENYLFEDEENKTDSGLDLSTDTDSGKSDKENKDLDVPESGDTSLDSSDSNGPDNSSDDTENSDEDEKIDLGGSSGGFGSGGGGGGFSFGGGGGSKSSSKKDETDSDASKKNEPESAQDLTQELLPEDPIEETTKIAIELANNTGNSQDILNAIKSNIQKYFSEPEDAVEIVQSLWDTEIPKLRSVAVKLLMFIKGD